ncbi:MAG: hypothetical protein WBD55_06775 [Dehalococcoidia bacterium]
MNWRWFYDEPPLPPIKRGGPWCRLIWGLAWAFVAIIIISILAFTAGVLVRPEPIGF